MRKTFILLILLQAIVLVSCTTQNEKKADAFINDFSNNNIKNDYLYESFTYGMYLSSESETVYKYKLDTDGFYVNVIEERSFSQYDTEIEAEMEQYIQAKNTKYTFYISSTTNQIFLYDQETSEYEFIKNINNSKINNAINEIHIYLGKNGELIAFDDLFPTLNESLLIGSTYGEISLFGDFDSKVMTFTVDKEDFLNNANYLKEHLKKIYDFEKYERVVESINDSDYNSLHLKFKWDSEKNLILPYFIISFRNIEYYVISVSADDFANNIDFH
ncbi:MAG: hypothetical protein ACLFUQ_03240 [Candidatus Izemoplasmataceae bacterium]